MASFSLPSAKMNRIEMCHGEIDTDAKIPFRAEEKKMVFAFSYGIAFATLNKLRYQLLNAIESFFLIFPHFCNKKCEIETKESHPFAEKKLFSVFITFVCAICKCLLSFVSFCKSGIRVGLMTIGGYCSQSPEKWVGWSSRRKRKSNTWIKRTLNAFIVTHFFLSCTNTPAPGKHSALHQFQLGCAVVCLQCCWHFTTWSRCWSSSNARICGRISTRCSVWGRRAFCILRAALESDKSRNCFSSPHSDNEIRIVSGLMSSASSFHSLEKKRNEDVSKLMQSSHTIFQIAIQVQNICAIE